MEKYNSIYKKNLYRKKEYGFGLFESSLSRVWQHAKKGFFMMSAFLEDVSFKENMGRHYNLKKQLKKVKLGFFELDGSYIYPDGKIESELSVFVPMRNIYNFDEFENMGKTLGKRFNQHSILLKEPDKLSIRGDYFLFYPRTKKTELVGNKIGYDKVADIYNRLRKGNHKGRTFIIEGFTVPDNYICAMGLKAEGIIWCL